MPATTTAPIAAGELVRSGQAIQVTLRAYDRTGVGVAARELARHVRITAIFGVFLPVEAGPMQEGGAWVYRCSGYTWRNAGSEYTPRQLHAACAAAYSAAGAGGTLALEVRAVGGLAADATAYIDALDPRSGGVVDRAGEIVGRTTEGAVSVVEGAGGLASGLGDAAAGLGEGAREVGGIARDWPLFTLFAVAGLAIAYAFRR